MSRIEKAHNAYALNVAHGTEDHVTLLKYREHVVTWLIRIEDDNEEEITYRNAIHNLMPHPQTEKKEKLTKPCVNCTKKKRRRETRYFCDRL